MKNPRRQKRHRYSLAILPHEEPTTTEETTEYPALAILPHEEPTTTEETTEYPALAILPHEEPTTTEETTEYPALAILPESEGEEPPASAAKEQHEEPL